MSLPILLIAALLAPVPADLPLYEQEPFDRITLNAANDHAVLDVEPLDFPDRAVPADPRPGERLRIRLLARPDVDYEVPWQAIDKVELFEQMVLADAEGLVAAGKLEEAYDYFAFLQQHYPKLPGLDAALETYVYEEAKAAHRAGRFDLALAMLRETYLRNPQREGLDKALGLATGSLVDHYAAEHDYAAVRAMIGNLAEWFPEHDLVVQWEARLRGQAEKLLDEARAAAAEERLGDASRLCRSAIAVWPDLPEAKALAEQLHARYPRVVVAVSDLAGPGSAPTSLIDWPARRTARLRHRTLMELVAPGTDGGRYLCPLGRFAAEELGQRLVFELQPAAGGSGGSAAPTGYDVSRHLLRLAAGGHWGSASAGTDLMAGVSVTGVYRVEVDLGRVHVRPERLLQTVVPPLGWPGPPESIPGNGPYRPANRQGGQAVFIGNERYAARQSNQPAEIVEQRMEPGRAVAELRAGTVDVIDRVAPWMLEELREEASGPDAAIAVEPYAFPLVHCLIPRPGDGLPSRRSFRRALVYGIDRERILRRLLGEGEAPGCEVADGPFPRGYARDPEVAPRPYDPHLAAALASVARRELDAVARQSETKGAGAAPSEPEADGDQGAGRNDDSEDGAAAGAPSAEAPLVLAHPDHSVAQAACSLIGRHLEVLGIAVSIRPLTPEETAGAEQGRFPEGVDLLYVELAAWEPVVDAARLFGAGGLCSHGSCYLQLGLRRLADAADWPAARAALNAIHRAVHDEVSVIPLWQLTEHFAYRTDLEGVGVQPVTLYQNVEAWRPAFRFASP